MSKSRTPVRNALDSLDDKSDNDISFNIEKTPIETLDDLQQTNCLPKPSMSFADPDVNTSEVIQMRSPEAQVRPSLSSPN